jgi:hypothetical protein
MRKLGIIGKRCIESSHLILSVIWLGGGICITILPFAWKPSGNGDLYAVDHAIALLDNWVVVPSAFGSLLAGLLWSWLTKWGFFKYRWVTLKWIGTVALMVYAPLFQNQWSAGMESISRAEGLAALQNPVYLQDRFLYTASGIGIVTALAALSIISTFKPWLKTDLETQKIKTTKVSATTGDRA